MSSTSFAFAPPEALAAVDRAAKTFLDAGAAAWATMSGVDVSFSHAAAVCAKPGEWVQGLGEALLTELSWSGDHQGRLFFVLEPTGAKALIAHMMALMMGGDANPDATQLDDEGMDAYAEAVNNLAGQGAQALRGELGGNIKLAVGSTRLVDFSRPDTVAALGDGEVLGVTGKLEVASAPEASMKFFLDPACLGLTLAPPETDAIPASVLPPDGADFAEDNLAHALAMRVPLVVILAERKMRMELIQELAPGSIIEFHKQSGESMDVYANNVKIATAEVVTINQHFGVQIQTLVDPREIATSS